MRRTLWTLVPLTLAQSASAQALPSYDRFAEQQAQQALNTQQLAITGDRVSSVEPRLGVPTFLWAGPLALPQGQSPQQAALHHLRTRASLYRLQGADGLSDAVVLRRIHTGQGAIIAEFEARLGATPVFRESLKVIMKQDLSLVAISGYLSPHAAQPDVSSYELSAPAAIAAAQLDLRGELTSPSDLIALETRGGYTRYRLGQQTARVRAVYYDLPDRLEPAYHLELSGHTYVISARSAQVLHRNSLLAADHLYSVYADPQAPHRPWDNPMVDVSPHPVGAPSPVSAPPVSASVIDLGHGPIQSQDPWLPEGAEQTVGNNVNAYADLVAPDGYNAGDMRAFAPGGRGFLPQHDPMAHPQANEGQTQAAVLNLFYVANHLHDEFYDAGFDEVWGNAQQNNLGRGGLEGDALRAEAQDHEGWGNANMLTPADGAPPRMQMFIFAGQQSAQAFLQHGQKTNESPQTAHAHFGPVAFNVEAPLALESALLSGRVALLDGTHDLIPRMQNIQTRGALGAIVVEPDPATAPAPLTGFSPDIAIPAVSLRQQDGRALLDAVLAGANITATLVGRAPTPVDASMDSTIVAHEWGHYIANRLIGDASGLFNHQGRALSEGWSDFHSLLMMVRQGDPEGGAYAVGGYAAQDPYFGLRRAPYSTDPALNALSLRHIEDGVALPEHPMATGPTRARNAEVHNAGEVWASMLWECYSSLLQAPQLSFEQARARMIELLVASYKATPVAPTFLEARDALLAVALAHGREDFDRFIQAFAKRGAGFGAQAPDRFSADLSGVVESFASGRAIKLVDVRLDDFTSMYCDRDGRLDRGEVGRLVITAKNVGWDNLRSSRVEVRSPNLEVYFPDGDTVTLPPTGPGEGVQVVLPIGLESDLSLKQIQVIASALDPDQTTPISIDEVYRFDVNLDETPNMSWVDSADAPGSPWNIPQAPGPAWTRATEINNRIWWGESFMERSDRTLVSPPMRVEGPLSLHFDHRFFLEEGFDGAVVEISTDGRTWTDLGKQLSPSYNRELSSAYGSPLAGRMAFSGMSEGFPAWVRVEAQLGEAYVGQTVQLRFRLATDALVSWWGWALDNIEIQGVAQPPFPQLSDDAGQCINRPPVAVTKGELVVDEGEEVHLDSRRSADLDGDALTFSWTQTEGPTVRITNERFIAPAPADQPELLLRFELTAHDGALSSAPAPLTVRVRNVNDAPRAFVSANRTVSAGAQVQLFGLGEDPEGSPLRYRWTQTEGPQVQLSDPKSPTPSFTAPGPGQKLTFALQVSDGELSSSPAVVRIATAPVAGEPREGPVSLTPNGVVKRSRSQDELRARPAGMDGPASSGCTCAKPKRRGSLELWGLVVLFGMFGLGARVRP